MVTDIARKPLGFTVRGVEVVGVREPAIEARGIVTSAVLDERLKFERRRIRTDKLSR